MKTKTFFKTEVILNDLKQTIFLPRPDDEDFEDDVRVILIISSDIPSPFEIFIGKEDKKSKMTKINSGFAEFQIVFQAGEEKKMLTMRANKPSKASVVLKKWKDQKSNGEESIPFSGETISASGSNSQTFFHRQNTQSNSKSSQKSPDPRVSNRIVPVKPKFALADMNRLLAPNDPKHFSFHAEQMAPNKTSSQVLHGVIKNQKSSFHFPCPDNSTEKSVQNSNGTTKHDELCRSNNSPRFSRRRVGKDTTISHSGMSCSSLEIKPAVAVDLLPNKPINTIRPVVTESKRGFRKAHSAQQNPFSPLIEEHKKTNGKNEENESQCKKEDLNELTGEIKTPFLPSQLPQPQILPPQILPPQILPPQILPPQLQQPQLPLPQQLPLPPQLQQPQLPLPQQLPPPQLPLPQHLPPPQLQQSTKCVDDETSKNALTESDSSGNHDLKRSENGVETISNKPFEPAVFSHVETSQFIPQFQPQFQSQSQPPFFQQHQNQSTVPEFLPSNLSLTTVSGDRFSENHSSASGKNLSDSQNELEKKKVQEIIRITPIVEESKNANFGNIALLKCDEIDFVNNNEFGDRIKDSAKANSAVSYNAPAHADNSKNDVPLSSQQKPQSQVQRSLIQFSGQSSQQNQQCGKLKDGRNSSVPWDPVAPPSSTWWEKLQNMFQSRKMRIILFLSLVVTGFLVFRFFKRKSVHQKTKYMDVRLKPSEETYSKRNRKLEKNDVFDNSALLGNREKDSFDLTFLRRSIARDADVEMKKNDDDDDDDSDDIMSYPRYYDDRRIRRLMDDEKQRKTIGRFSREPTWNRKDKNERNKRDKRQMKCCVPKNTDSLVLQSDGEKEPKKSTEQSRNCLLQLSKVTDVADKKGSENRSENVPSMLITEVPKVTPTKISEKDDLFPKKELLEQTRSAASMNSTKLTEQSPQTRKNGQWIPSLEMKPESQQSQECIKVENNNVGEEPHQFRQPRLQEFHQLQQSSSYQECFLPKANETPVPNGKYSFIPSSGFHGVSIPLMKENQSIVDIDLVPLAAKTKRCDATFQRQDKNYFPNRDIHRHDLSNESLTSHPSPAFNMDDSVFVL